LPYFSPCLSCIPFHVEAVNAFLDSPIYCRCIASPLFGPVVSAIFGTGGVIGEPIHAHHTNQHEKWSIAHESFFAANLCLTSFAVTPSQADQSIGLKSVA